MTEFVPVGPADDVPEGELRLFEVAGRPVAVARWGGELHALDDACTHQGCSLADGELEDGAVVCPCHAGEFELATGEVLSGPPPEPVHVYPVRVLDGVLEIGM